MLKELEVTINIFLEGLDDKELATLHNVAISKVCPRPNHIGYLKWIGLYHLGRTTLDDDVVNLIQDEILRRENRDEGELNL
tara:strand:+ start:2359 stop:2601 length:243 start_codon:yes stop_codon:yes gene_type:complete